MKRKWFWGVALIVIGSWLWLSKLGMPYISFSRNWPLILVGLGIYLIIRKIVKQQRRQKSVTDILNQLESGKIDADKAISEIRRGK